MTQEEIIKDYLKNHLKLSIKERKDDSGKTYIVTHIDISLKLDDEILSEDGFSFIVS